MRLCLVAALLLPARLVAQDVDPGRRAFEERCGR
jgi:hypothetical protein